MQPGVKVGSSVPDCPSDPQVLWPVAPKARAAQKADTEADVPSGFALN
jgi:hypothetical protein